MARAQCPHCLTVAAARLKHARREQRRGSTGTLTRASRTPSHSTSSPAPTTNMSQTQDLAAASVASEEVAEDLRSPVKANNKARHPASRDSSKDIVFFQSSDSARARFSLFSS